MLCGGTDASESCEMFDGISAFKTVPASLIQERYNLLCWGLETGEVLLLGGGTTMSTVERVKEDGSHSFVDFDLVYGIS